MTYNEENQQFKEVEHSIINGHGKNNIHLLSWNHRGDSFMTGSYVGGCKIWKKVNGDDELDFREVAHILYDTPSSP